MPTNPRMTKKERALLRGAVRRVFSRSELRARALAKALVADYHDPSRKRVTRWFRCTECKKLEPAYLAQIDHIEPVIPLDREADSMELEEVVDRSWCDEKNLQPLCKPCHLVKSKAENKERRAIKKGKKK